MANAAMAGIVPMDKVRSPATQLTIGYRDAHAVRDTLLLDRGQSVRMSSTGRHPSRRSRHGMPRMWSTIVSWRMEGFASGQTLASYLHVYFGAEGSGRLARRFVAARPLRGRRW